MKMEIVKPFLALVCISAFFNEAECRPKIGLEEAGGVIAEQASGIQENRISDDMSNILKQSDESIDEDVMTDAHPLPVRRITRISDDSSQSVHGLLPVRNPNPSQSADGLLPVRNPNPNQSAASGPLPVRAGPIPVRAGPIPVRAYVPQVPGIPKVRNTQPSQSADGLLPVRNPNPTQSADGLLPVRNPNPNQSTDSSPLPVRAGPIPVRAGPVPVRAYVPKVKNTQPNQSGDGLVPVRNPNPTQSADGLLPVRNPNPSGPQPVRAGPLPVRAGPVPARAYVPQVPGTPNADY